MEKAVNKISKRLHCCWFGDKPMGEREKRCIESWKRFCPDYEIVYWNQNNAPIAGCRYAEQALAAQKWAFVSDYVRLKVLIEQGGFYLDTDVELVAPLDDFLCCSGVMGFEAPHKVATCVIGAEPNHPFFEQACAMYDTLEFIRPDGSCDLTTNVDRITALLRAQGLQLDGSRQTAAGIELFPQEVFSPKDLETGRIHRTGDTCAIHHFNASWMPLSNRINTRLAQLLGPKLTRVLKKLLRRG